MKATGTIGMVFLGLLAVGCEDEPQARWFELKVGASWIYRVTDDTGAQHQKTNTVETQEDVGGAWAGTTAFRVRTETADETNLSWQEDSGDAVRRLRDKTYDSAGVLTLDEHYQPYKLRIDETKTKVGQSWTEVYTEVETDPATGETDTNDRADQWTVLSTDEEVTVPAGTFRCLRLHRVSLETSSIKTYWFARGVGKVKETGGQTEELAAHTVP